ncbi:hypothetical protein C8J56DRAFT_800426, partial [Mycena floridula]
AVRVEWAKAQVRKERWSEEVLILKEEMRHVIRFLLWQEKEWNRRGERDDDDADVALASGLGAYTSRQADFAASTRCCFEDLWTHKAA